MKICSKAHQIELLKKFLVGRGMLRSHFNKRMALQHTTKFDRQQVARPPPPLGKSCHKTYTLCIAG